MKFYYLCNNKSKIILPKKDEKKKLYDKALDMSRENFLKSKEVIINP